MAFASNSTTFGLQSKSNTPLFGGSVAAQPTTNIFGNPLNNQQQQQQPSAAPSFFSNSNPNPSSFGSFVKPPTINTTPQQAQQQQQNIWGTTTNLNPLFSQSTATTGPLLNNPAQASTNFNPFGIFNAGAQNRPQLGLSTFQIQPQNLVTQGPPLFTKTTKFNDLSEDVRKVFEAIDGFIQGRIQISKELEQQTMGGEILKAQELLKEARREFRGVANTTQADLVFAQDIKEKTEQAVKDTLMMAKIVDNFRSGLSLGSQGGQSVGGLGGLSKREAAFQLDFFTRVTEQMRERLVWCKNTIAQIEKKLSGAVTPAQYNPQSIASTLQLQHATCLMLASRTAEVHAELQKLKALYTSLWRARTRSATDPFEDGLTPEEESGPLDGLKELSMQ